MTGAGALLQKLHRNRGWESISWTEGAPAATLGVTLSRKLRIQVPPLRVGHAQVMCHVGPDADVTGLGCLTEAWDLVLEAKEAG